MLTFALVLLGFVSGLITGNLLLQLAYQAGLVKYIGIAKRDAARAAQKDKNESS